MLAWSSLSPSELLQSELGGVLLLGLGGLLFTVVGALSACLVFFDFTSCMNWLSDSLATFGKVQDCLGLKLGYKFLSINDCMNSVEGLLWVSLSHFRNEEGGVLSSLQGIKVFSLECLSCLKCGFLLES